MMKIFPTDIIAGILIVVGILQILLGIFIWKYTSRTRTNMMMVLGSALVALCILFAYFSINNLETGMVVTAIGWALWLVIEVLLIFIWRWRSR